jgi:hypothetical protein
MQGHFDAVGRLKITFDGGKEAVIIGGEGVVTTVDLESDKDHCDVDMKCFELERGLVMRSIFQMPPIAAYEFEDVFMVIDNNYRKTGERQLTEKWEKRDETSELTT